MTRDTAQNHTLIIGAGPAGLAVAACLKQLGIDSLILEQNQQVGSAWHRHYERLHLHTAKAHSALPFLPFPRDYPRYPSRTQVMNYLEAYAAHFGLTPRLGQQVIAANHVGDAWQVKTQDTRYEAQNLVIAAGYTRVPHRPHWPGEDQFQGRIQHSADYRNGAPFRDQKVLVVGFGNSGGEIAIDLWEHGAQPSLAVRGPVNVIPRELFGIPILAISIAQHRLPPRLADALNEPILRVALGDLTRCGLRSPPRGPLAQIQHDARIPLIDVGTIKLIQQGHIRVYPGIERFTAAGVNFTDGQHGPFDAVILATGYRPQVNAFLAEALAVCDSTGTPLASGTSTSLPGLYFCGYHVSPTGMLREIGLEARRISAAIAHQPVS